MRDRLLDRYLMPGAQCRFMARPPIRTIPAGDVTLACREYGAGEPLVLYKTRDDGFPSTTYNRKKRGARFEP